MTSRGVCGLAGGQSAGIPMSSGTRPLHRAQVTVAECLFCPSEKEDERKRKQRDTHNQRTHVHKRAHKHTHDVGTARISSSADRTIIGDRRTETVAPAADESGREGQCQQKPPGRGAWGARDSRAQKGAPSPGLESDQKACVFG
jgi:hypothetical protein